MNPDIIKYQRGSDLEINYPLKEIPEIKSTLHSPSVGNAHQVPAFDKNRYEEYLNEVLQVRLDVLNGEYPHWFLEKHWPDSWGPYISIMPDCLTSVGANRADPSGCANLVRMDLPLDFGNAVLRWLMSHKVKFKEGGTPHFDFLGYIPGNQMDLSREILVALSAAFEVKYYYGIARPSEVWEIMRSSPGSRLEQYPHPHHPSYIAGHSVVAGVSAKYFLEEFALSEEQQLEIKLAAYLFGMYRTFAGVHYAVDNLEGLKFGGLNLG